MTKRPPQNPPHRIAPDWKGRDVFIIGGGTSVDLEAVQLLKGRPNSATITVNMSYLLTPWADVLFYADDRFYQREKAERPDKLNGFAGEIMSISRFHGDPRVKQLVQVIPPGLASDRGAISMQRSSITGAVGIAVHKGAGRIILVGVDNRDGEDGKIHYHAEYPWPRNRKTWVVKEKEFRPLGPALARLKIEVINASPISSLDWWPRVALADWLKENPA